ncbi:hypothetical protein OA07_16460 [Aphanizomenon flos-aquae 2012/KM1/D3]|nr:hypothetical protein OA07_16460 [Aphanizomenon flos-aquae 2012/KM1/D3]
MTILQTVHSLTKYETPLVNLSPHPSLTLPYKGGKRSSFYNWRGFEPCSLYGKKVQLLAVLSITPRCAIRIVVQFPEKVLINWFMHPNILLKTQTGIKLKYLQNW